jgi:hypothetical protein
MAVAEVGSVAHVSTSARIGSIVGVMMLAAPVARPAGAGGEDAPARAASRQVGRPRRSLAASLVHDLEHPI